ncbi:MAG: CRTAC1 family protein [Pseudomonadota bacterium]
MKRLLALLFCCTSAQAADAPYPFDVPQMEEVAGEAGIDHTYGGPFEYFVGGGAASFDCNGDRLADVFLAGGAGAASLYVNRSRAGALKFERQPSGEITRVTGAYPLDIDGDGNIDLAVLRVGENLLLRGNGDCTFEKANRAWGFDGGREWTTGFSAMWEQGSRFPTLAFINYIDRTAPGSPWGTCEPNVLARPAAGDAPDYTKPQMLEPGHCALSALFTDWNNTGEPALRITNDRQYYRGGEEQLWRVPAGRPARPYRSADGWQRLQIWGMGIASHDLDADGRPEYALTSMGDTKLQTLDDEAEEDRPVYRDTAFARGATAHRPYAGDDGKPSTGWHAQFADFNNDARTDLFIAKGNVEAMPDFAKFDPDNMLLADADGRFFEAGARAGIDKPTRGRGALVEDFDRDGMLDLLVVNRGAPVSLFRNAGRVAEGSRALPMGNFLAIELRDKTGANISAVGARISVKTGNLTQNQTVAIGGGHASGQSGFQHFGLGVAERASVRVQWPATADGEREWSHAYRAFANSHIVITKGAAEPMMWFPPERQ